MSIREEHRDARLGYWLAKGRQGNGTVTKSCRALIQHGFSALNLNRIVASAALKNARSRAVLERLGFQYYGVSPDAEWLYDHFVDHAQYALLSRNWNTVSELA